MCPQFVIPPSQLVSPAVYEKHQKKSVKEAEANMKNTFHCKTPDCAGWTIFDDDVNIFKCPLCTKVNCINCQVKDTPTFSTCSTVLNQNSFNDTNFILNTVPGCP